MKYLRKEIEKLVETEAFVSYEEFIYELEEEKEEVKNILIGEQAVERWTPKHSQRDM